MKDLDNVRQNSESEHKNDEYIIGRNMALLMFVGLVIVLFALYILFVIDWL